MCPEIGEIFTREWLIEQFPSDERTEAFFDALFGGTEEGAYTISLRYDSSKKNIHNFFFDLHQRPGKCLACNLTYGLPQVFSRHPCINAKGIAEAVAKALGYQPDLISWRLLTTQEMSRELHSIPFVITVQ